MSNWDDLFEHMTPHDREIYIEQCKINDARDSLLEFITFTKPNYIVNWHHRIICEKIDQFLADPDKRRLMVFVGPRRGKSEIISRRLPAYYLGRYPDKKIIATSYSSDLSTALNREVQRIIDDEVYHKVFPETTLSASNVRTTSKKNYVRTSDRFEIVGHEGYYRSAGVGGGITGMGADLALIDDPLKDMAEAMSPKRKDVVMEWYASTLYTRLSKVGKIIIILTRWAEDDLAGRLLKEAKANDEADQWEVLCFPEEYDPEHPYVCPDDPRTEKGQILWPEWFPEDKVKKTKASVGSKVWGSLFQQTPAPDGGAIFKAQWFNYFKEPPDFEYICSSWDCAFKDSASSDYVAGGVWGVAGANKYLLYLVRERLSFVDTVKEMLRVHAKYPNQRFMLVEDKANGPAVVSTLKNKIPGLITYSPKESKESRANAVSPQYEAGNIWLPDKYYEPNRSRYAWCVKGVDEYVEEHKNFPFGGNDDTVDMTTQFLLKVGNVPSWLDELAKGKEGGPPMSAEDKRTKDFEQSLMEKMGWDGQSGSGLPFNLNF